MRSLKMKLGKSGGLWFAASPCIEGITFFFWKDNGVGVEVSLVCEVFGGVVVATDAYQVRSADGRRTVAKKTKGTFTWGAFATARDFGFFATDVPLGSSGGCIRRIALLFWSEARCAARLLRAPRACASSVHCAARPSQRQPVTGKEHEKWDRGRLVGDARAVDAECR